MYDDKKVEQLILFLLTDNRIKPKYCPSDAKFKEQEDCNCDNYNYGCKECWKQALKGD